MLRKTMLGLMIVPILTASIPIVWARSPQAEGFQKLDDAGIRQAFIGRQFSDDVHFRLDYTADGQVLGFEMGRKVANRWRVEGGQLCVAAEAHESCYTVWKKANEVRLLIEEPDISIDGTLQ